MKNILIIFLFVVATYGCKKKYDYRDKFLGNYTFTIHKEEWTFMSPSIYSTYSYHGNVKYGTLDSTVLITFSNDTVKPSHAIETIVYEEGSFQAHYFLHGGIAGEFESTKNVKFFILNYSLSSGYRYDVTGEKEQ